MTPEMAVRRGAVSSWWRDSPWSDTLTVEKRLRGVRWLRGVTVPVQGSTTFIGPVLAAVGHARGVAFGSVDGDHSQRRVQMNRAYWRRFALVTFASGVFLSAMAGCGGHDTTKPESGNCQFSGITQTDESGIVISDDPDDWACPADTGSSGGGTRVYPARPNPARPRTVIRFSLARAQHLTIAILGPPSCDTVRTLVRSDQAAGMHEVIWDGVSNEGSVVAPGVYRCVLTAGSFSCHGDIEIQRSGR